MKRYLFFCLFVWLLPSFSFAAPESNTQALGIFNDTGWGASVAISLAAFKLDGSLDVFSAGVGGGVSYKLVTPKNGYPMEFGAYLAPQFSRSSGSSTGSVAFLLHAVLFRGFGVGVGYSFWYLDHGLMKPELGTTFFTLGVGMTNSVGQ